MVYQALFSYLSRSLQHAHHWLLPARCIACGDNGGLILGRSTHAPLDLCESCYQQFPFNYHACRGCSLPLSTATSELLCGQCLRAPTPYQRSFCAFEYLYPIADLVRHYKYGDHVACARLLGELLADHLRSHHPLPWPECIIPVPLHTRRYQQRGYNQVIEIGRFLSSRLKLPLRPDVLQRIRATPEQASLTRTERQKNLRHAFRVVSPHPPAHVAILDDVITTGSTVAEVASTLRNSGVAQIEVWGVARAVIGHS